MVDQQAKPFLTLDPTSVIIREESIYWLRSEKTYCL